MTLLAGMSGAHATGKSRTLDRIQELSPSKNIIVDNFKVSRRVLAELELTLEQATATAESTKNYQTKVLDAKIGRDSIFCRQTESIKVDRVSFLVDRTVADIYAYTRLWSDKNEIDETWFRNFEARCIEAMFMYDIIFLFPINKLPFVDDGVRAKEDTQRSINKYLEDFVIDHAKRYHVIKSVKLDDRVNEIIKVIQR